MWTSNVYGHHDKMARNKNTQNTTKHGVYKEATGVKK